VVATIPCSPEFSKGRKELMSILLLDINFKFPRGMKDLGVVWQFLGSRQGFDSC
jgi:hypothetical protein